MSPAPGPKTAAKPSTPRGGGSMATGDSRTQSVMPDDGAAVVEDVVVREPVITMDDIEVRILAQDKELGARLRHLVDCPCENDFPREPESRVEAYDLEDRAGRACRAVRCIECGEGIVDIKVVDAVPARVRR